MSASRGQRRWQRRWLAWMVVMATLAWTSVGSAAIRRYALIVGNNRGDAGEVELRHAETDAQRTYDVLKDLGGFDPVDMVLLRGETAPRLQSTLIAMNDRIRATIASGADAVLFVYYSGHASADALHLNGTRVALTQLEQLVRGSSATFRMLMIDACRSGALTRVKGGTGAAPFDIRIDERLSEEGLVFLTSTSANEDAQESDVLKASFFTHHFVSALLGAADADGDGRVTLEEAYRYTYEGTLRSTSATWAGPQHPSFRYEMRGAGKLVLTELPTSGSARATLVFPQKRAYLVLEGSDRGAVVAEVTEAAASRRISVRPGRYFVRGRAPDTLLEGEIDAASGASVDVNDARLRRIAYARLVRKGEGAPSLAHGPEAGYAFRTALGNSTGPCHGGFAGYAVHFEHVSLGARFLACHSGFENDILRASTNDFGGELRAFHTWDLPHFGIAAGLAGGAWVFHQSFTTRGVAPSRSTPAASLGIVAAPHVDLGSGFSVFAESAFLAYLYAQRDEVSGATSLGPTLSFRQAFGLHKTW